MPDDWKTISGLVGLRCTFDESKKPMITVDVDQYQEYLDGSDLTDEQKTQFLQALWNVIQSFVELGYGVHPLQEVCGKEESSSKGGSKESFNAVCSEEAKNIKKNKGAGRPRRSKPRGGLEVE